MTMRAIIAAIVTIATSAATAAAADPLELSAFIALPKSAPTAVLQYGTADAQGIDVFLPAGGVTTTADIK